MTLNENTIPRGAYRKDIVRDGEVKACMLRTTDNNWRLFDPTEMIPLNATAFRLALKAYERL